jgi:hypothetical protein
MEFLVINIGATIVALLGYFAIVVWHEFAR